MQTVDRLQAIREELGKKVEQERAELAVDPASRGEDLTASQHPADVASDLSAREQLITVERHLSADLIVLDEALRRARDGTYGICADCAKPIAAERLEVLPQAIRCIDCQRREERTHTRNSLHR